MQAFLKNFLRIFCEYKFEPGIVAMAFAFEPLMRYYNGSKRHNAILLIERVAAPLMPNLPIGGQGAGLPPVIFDEVLTSVRFTSWNPCKRVFNAR